jgi:uncharacterized protein YkwD
MTPRAGIQVAAAPLAAVLLLAAAGCGAALSANRRSPGVIESGTFKPTRAPAANYGPDPSLTCPDRGINGLVADDLGGKAQPDGRLCAVAETLLGWPGPEGEVPPESVLSVISSDFGLPQTVRKLLITTVNTAERGSRGDIPGLSEKDVAGVVAEPIRNFASTAQVPRYGLITERVSAGHTKIVLVMQDENVELKPVPRKLNPGQSAALSGTVLGKLQDPKVQYTDAVGKLEKVEGQAGKAFNAELKCGDRPGRMVVQIIAEQEGANVQVANFPVGCGTELPVAAAVPTAGAKQATTTDPAAAEKQLADQVNQDRTAAGLKPLAVDSDLSKVARSLSDDRAKGKGTTPEEVQRRLQEVDISAPTILVSEAQAFGAEDAWMKFSNSPQDRSNAMNPDMTQLGVGVAPGPVVDKRPMVIVTALYLKQLPPPDPDALKASLYQAIERRRADARAGALAKDPQLEQIAQAYATQMAKDKGKVPKEKVAEIEAPLYKSFSTVNELGGVKADPMEFAEEPGIVGDAKLVGVGVGIGNSPQFGKNSAYVVILVGKKHGAAKTPTATQKKPAKKK